MEWEFGGAHAAVSMTVALADGISPGIAALGADPGADRVRTHAADGYPLRERQRRGDAGGLAHGHAGRDLPRELLRGFRRRIVAPGNEQSLDILRQHRAIGRVIVAAPRHGVGEMHAAVHVVLCDDIRPSSKPRLAHAELRRDIDDEAFREARMLARMSRRKRRCVGGPRNQPPTDQRPSWRRTASCAGNCTIRRRAAASAATSGPMSRRSPSSPSCRQGRRRPAPRIGSARPSPHRRRRGGKPS